MEEAIKKQIAISLLSGLILGLFAFIGNLIGNLITKNFSYLNFILFLLFILIVIELIAILIIIVLNTINLNLFGDKFRIPPDKYNSYPKQNTNVINSISSRSDF
jgi:hypothetical protein